MKLIKNKRGVELQNFFASVVVFMFFIIAFFAFSGSLAGDYNVELNNSIEQRVISQLNESEALSTEFSQNINVGEASLTDQVITFITNGISSLRIMFNMIPIVHDLAFIVQDIFGIPGIVLTIGFMLLSIAITFAIIRAILSANT